MVGKKGGGHASPSHQNGASASSSLASERTGKEQSRPAKATSTLKQRIWAKVEASVWVLGALFALIYGDGQHNLPHVLLHDARLKRWAVYDPATVMTRLLSTLGSPDSIATLRSTECGCVWAAGSWSSTSSSSCTSGCGEYLPPACRLYAPHLCMPCTRTLLLHAGCSGTGASERTG